MLILSIEPRVIKSEPDRTISPLNPRPHGTKGRVGVIPLWQRGSEKGRERGKMSEKMRISNNMKMEAKVNLRCSIMKELRKRNNSIYLTIYNNLICQELINY